MKRTLAGMMIVASFVFLMGSVGGMQNDTLGIIEAFFAILGSFLLFLIGALLFGGRVK